VVANVKCIIKYEDSKFYTTMEEEIIKVSGEYTSNVMYMFDEIIDRFPEAQIYKVAFSKADDTILIYLRNRREFLMEALTEYFDNNKIVQNDDD
jgi:hypothetical protein